MNDRGSRAALQVFLTIIGLVAVVAGLATVLGGARTTVGVDAVSPTVDSEMRFYAIWYFGAGLLLLRSSARLESDRRTISLIALLFFFAGCARVLSWVVVGRPHALSLALMSIELALPFVILPWLAAVSREPR